MSKRILLGLLLSFSPLLANAEYMGIDQLPVSGEDVNKVFLEAVKSKDFEAISSWKDKINQVYDQTGFCSFSTMTVYPDSPQPKTLLTKDTNSNDFAFAMSSHDLSIVPTNCNSISLWEVYSKLDQPQYSYDIFKSTGTLSLLEKDHIPSAETYEKRRNIIIDFMNKVPDDKYQLFLPIVFQNNADFKIRNLALDKYLSGRKAEANKPVNNNDIYSQLKEKMSQATKTNTNWKSSFDDTLYMSIFQPDLLLLTEMNRKVLDSLSLYWDIYSSRKDVLPPFNKEVIAKGGYTDEELKAFDLSNKNLRHLDEVSLYRLYNANENIKLFHRVYENYIKNNDINIQKDDGNTILSEMMVDTSYTIPGNPFAGSFIRFYLENGANPLLKNRDGDTAFSAFMNNYGQDSSANEVKKAFVEKQYDFDPSLVK